MSPRFSISLFALVPALIFVPLACGGDDAEPPSNGASLSGGLCAAGCRAPLVCDATIGCVECTNDSACPTAKPRCIGGACAVCATNADCPASINACSPTDHACHVACGTGSSVACDKGTQCDPKTGACVVCAADSDCAGTGRPLCDPERKTCVACVSNTHCAASAPVCARGRGECVECVTNRDCPSSAPTCTADLECHGGCLSDSSCSGGEPFCNMATGECVECRGSSDCRDPGLPLCHRGHCAQCTDATSCPSTAPFCANGRCVACRDDSSCPSSAPRCKNGSCGS
jgi:hypothetical protein